MAKDSTNESALKIKDFAYVAPGGLEPRSKIWIEQDGDVVLSDWRIKLLEAIDRTGSLAKAADEMGVPYRSAWQRLKESEERLRVRLVDTQSGGAVGGGSVLTEAAHDLVRRYRRFTDGLAELVDRRFKENFS
ncbi:MAG: LysR family transcriptional regulator [Chloroflexi bacterium]|nr:LysR family transcriptional regulator [Chloroflexota bacterium]